MKKYKQVTKNFEVVDSVICNNCGTKCTNSDDAVVKDFLEVDVSWGYFSNKDGERHRWELCEKCYDEIVSNFSIEPQVVSYD